MQNEGEFFIPSREIVVQWLREAADTIESGSVGAINRGVFIGLDRGTGRSYKPIVSMMGLDADEALALLEVSKHLLIDQMFEGAEEDETDSHSDN